MSAREGSDADRPFVIELQVYFPSPDPLMLAEQQLRLNAASVSAAAAAAAPMAPRLSCRCVNADTASDALPGLQLEVRQRAKVRFLEPASGDCA